MKAVFFTFSIILISLNLFGQELILKSFVKHDTVMLRWAPANYELLKLGLKNGYTVERIPDGENFETSNTKVSTQVLPFNDRQQVYLASSDEVTRGLAESIASLFFGPQKPESATSLTYFSLIFGASTNKLLAEMLGIYFLDFPSNGEYLYRISINKSEIKSNTIKADPAKQDRFENMTHLSGSARTKLKQVYLSWEALSLEKNYAAYWIERSNDSVHFTTQNSTPYFFFKTQDEPNKFICDFVDTSVVEGGVYYYRIRGITHFAESGAVSNTVKIYVPKSIFGEIHIDSVTANENDRYVRGTVTHHRNGNEITALKLFRSDSLSFGYSVLASQPYLSDDFEFKCKVPLTSGDRYYYRVAAIGIDNDTLYSFPYYFFTLDQIPPLIPENLTGTINDSGIVSLQWNPNSENDIRGYRIYRSNALNEEFIEVSQHFSLSPVFHDTLRLDNLSSEVYYKVSAVDLNYNNSKQTAAVLIVKPDTIPPVSAILIDYLVVADGLELKWINSTSSDVRNNKLIRSSGLQRDTVFSWNNESSEIKDTSCTNGGTYTYTILTEDFSGNQSHSQPIRVNYETGIRSGISNLKGVPDREKKQIVLTWSLPSESVYSVQIYRAVNSGNLILYKTIRSENLVEFVDSQLSMNNTYTYKVKVVYKTGASSLFSDTVQVIY